MKKLHILALSTSFLFGACRTQTVKKQEEKIINISSESLANLDEYLGKKYRSKNEIIEYLTQQGIPSDLAESVARAYSKAYSKSIFDILATSVLPAVLTSLLTTILFLSSFTVTYTHSPSAR